MLLHLWGHASAVQAGVQQYASVESVRVRQYVRPCMMRTHTDTRYVLWPVLYIQYDPVRRSYSND
jgi:hypothetical protein